ncbi:hypothetical protein BaRGS_00008623 [Batillaria attramentaria]|uniref:Uncharacterized protein n=1 Tax=Batillaria attramentaria TaxID=370345 RepID=A0ABD0LLG2_9CAEN
MVKLVFSQSSSTLTSCVAAALVFATASVQFSEASEAGGNLPKLMLFSFDGFGWNYLQKLPKSSIPNFHKFIDSGVHVRWIENVFPTVTRTNHMSMVTGLYAESHGIVHNHFYDSALNASVPSPGNLTDSKWVDVGSEPIWVTNSKAGGNRRSGCILWPCADAKIKGILPEKQMPGEWTVTLETFNSTERIDLALKWLTDPSEEVNFVAVYFDQPDEISHQHGPDSEEVATAIRTYDKTLEYLLNQIEEKGLSGKLNVIITADHGQLPVRVENQVNIDSLVEREWFFSQPYLDRPRTMINMWPKQEGSHGWDPRYSINMYPFFIATGPAFKKGVRDAAPFRMVDIYPMMCHILGLEPAPNNGTLDNVRHILATDERSRSLTSYVGVTIGVIVAMLGVVAVVVILWKIRQGRNVSASYKRTFAKAGTWEDQRMQDGMVVLSDEEL